MSQNGVTARLNGLISDVPVQCVENNAASCVSMGEQYVAKYDVQGPMCYQVRSGTFYVNIKCLSLETLRTSAYVRAHSRGAIYARFQSPLATEMRQAYVKTASVPNDLCASGELQAMIVATPGDSAYRGTMMTMFCCINVDPRRFIPENGVSRLTKI